MTRYQGDSDRHGGPAPVHAAEEASDSGRQRCFCVESSTGMEPTTPSLPWNHQEPLCGPPFPQVAPDRRGQSYRFSLDEGMRFHGSD